MPGLFVTLEGGEGSGKSTQLGRLAERLRREGHDPLVTREPGGTPLAERIRVLLLEHAEQPVPLAEALLLVAARAELVAKAVRPALAAGRIVLCDRFTDSTLAYQGAGRGLDRSLLEILNRAATLGLEPALTLLFDLPVREGLDRRGAAHGALNRMDREPAEFHERVRGAYLELARRDAARFAVIDASAAAAVVERQVWEAVSARLAQAGVAAPPERR